MHEVDFTVPPALGHTLERYTNRYECVGVEPYTRRSDGAASWLLTWSSACADCGAPFTCRTGLQAKSLNRRCDEHKNPRLPASEEAREVSREAKREILKKARAAQRKNPEAVRAALRKGRATQRENRKRAKAYAALLK